MTPLDSLRAYLPSLSPARLEALREESNKSVGGGQKGPVESAVSADVARVIEAEMRRRSEDKN